MLPVEKSNGENIKYMETICQEHKRIMYVDEQSHFLDMYTHTNTNIYLHTPLLIGTIKS